TNPPGNVVFEPLYNLPLGWLLREPGRFLMVAGLAYAILTGVVVEALFRPESFAQLIKAKSLQIRDWRLVTAPLALVTAVVLGFPLITGAVVPDTRPRLPPAHVQLPAYWAQMANVVDEQPTQGALLVLPPDDFYGMPYKWGY